VILEVSEENRFLRVSLASVHDESCFISSTRWQFFVFMLVSFIFKVYL